MTNTDPANTDPASTGTASTTPRQPRRRRRTVLWASLGVACVVAVLIAVMASAQPSSEVSGRSALLGNAAPAISGPGLDGGHYSLAQLRGKWVLVNFMATWCEPCRQEVPQLLDFVQEHARSGDATVLTVVDDPSDAGRLKTFLAGQGANWPAVNDPAATVSYGLAGLPSSFLVAPNGVVYAYLLGQVHAAELDSWLKRGGAKAPGGA